MRWGRVVFASSVLAAVGCASIIGIEDTVDEPGLSLVDGSVPDTAPDEDVLLGGQDDGSSSTEVPVDEDASTQADVANIDAPVSTTCAETGLVARWKLDEGAGNVVLDCSGNGHHGVVEKGTWTSNGADGGALKFVGTGWVGFANPALLRITGAFTISLWMRPDRTVADNTDYLFGKTSSPAENGYRLGIITGQDFALATASSSSNFNVVGGNASVSAWKHIAAVYRPSTATELWENGTKVGNAGGAPAALVPSNAEARLGARVDGKYGFTGAFSDVRVYNRALSAAEISALSKR